MIDTVRICQPRYLRESTARRNWDIIATRREVADNDGFEDEYLRSYSGTHKKMGIRFFGDRDRVITVEASLPRVLFGHNGKLLQSRGHIQAALRKLNRTLDNISHPPEGPPCFKRVDLVWHVPGSCADFIVAHQHVRHPRIRKSTCIYQGESITWRGSEFNLLLYDKTRKEQRRPGQFVRVEAQLRKRLLDELFEESGHVLDFPRCYRYLRDLVLQLQPAVTPAVSGFGSFIAACARLNAPEDEVHPVEAYIQELCPRRRRDLRRQIEAASSTTRAVNWRLLLPEVPPANPPELEQGPPVATEDDEE